MPLQSGGGPREVAGDEELGHKGFSAWSEQGRRICRDSSRIKKRCCLVEVQFIEDSSGKTNSILIAIIPCGESVKEQCK